MMSPLTRTIFFSRSTVAPLASQISSARCDGKRTPTCSMIHNVASWIFLTSSVVKISSFSFGLLIDLMFLDIEPSRGYVSSLSSLVLPGVQSLQTLDDVACFQRLAPQGCSAK